MPELRPVTITGVGLLCPAGVNRDGLGAANGGSVPGFRARDHIADRKSLKLMTTAVQLGISAIQIAVDDDGGLADVLPGSDYLGGQNCVPCVHRGNLHNCDYR